MVLLLFQTARAEAVKQCDKSSGLNIRRYCGTGRCRSL